MWELIGECYMYEMMAGDALIERRLAHEQEIRKRKEEELDVELYDFFHKDRRLFKIRWGVWTDHTSSLGSKTMIKTGYY